MSAAPRPKPKRKPGRCPGARSNCPAAPEADDQVIVHELLPATGLTSGGFLQGVSPGFPAIPINIIAFATLPAAPRTEATSIYSLMRNVGSSIGISFVTTMVARRAQFHQARLVEAISAYEPGVRNTLDLYRGALRGAGAPPGAAGREGLGLLYGQVVQQANLMAFVDLFYLLGILFLLVVPIVWFMRSPRQKARGAAAAH